MLFFSSNLSRRRFLLTWALLEWLGCVHFSESFLLHGGASFALSTGMVSGPTHRSAAHSVKMNVSPRRKSGSEDRRADLTVYEMEKDVMESTRARLDMQRVSRVFDPEEDLPTSPWNIAVAAGAVAAGLSFLAMHSLFLSGVALVAVILVATSDPLEEESAAGAAARVLGRVTLKSAKAAKPKVRAIARAAVHGEEEWLELQSRVQRLEQENSELLLWKHRRIAIDDASAYYSLDELKDMARRNGLTIGGSKTQLMVRLVEARVLSL